MAAKWFPDQECYSGSDYWVSKAIIAVRYITVRIHMLRWIYGDTRSESSLSTKAIGITHVEQDE